MEARGEFTVEGCIEMACVMGFIKRFDGRLKDGSLYVGWVDSKTNEPVDDKDVKSHYEKEILLHPGIYRLGTNIHPFSSFDITLTLYTEPESFRGYDPNKVFNQEVELIHDLVLIAVSDSEAQKFKL